MIIQSSNMTSSAGRYYNMNKSVQTTDSAWDNMTGALSSSTVTEKESYTESSGTFQGILNKRNQQMADMMEEYQSLQRTAPTTSITSQFSDIQKLKQKVLDYLLYILSGKNYKDMKDSNDYGDMFLGNNALSGGKGSSQNVCYFYQESEMMHFETTGTAVTADGRNINFNIDLTMTRSYMEATNTYVETGQPYLCDPLVINLGGDGTSVTDQKFLFDIDCDGEEDSISRLGAGNGYLALDLNGDGIINDGSELFGTKSGNGFADLATYDKDGNGWIDEADEIFSKLKVWTMDENGVSTLLSLKDAGVGAIYLGSKDTQFSLTNAQNEVNAMVRKTGMFLYETGMAGTIQQVDMAVTKTA